MADIDIALHWTGSGLAFEGGGEGGPTVVVDGDRTVGASPMQLLLVSLAACTAADVVDILGKMRVPLEALTVRAVGDRAAEPPRYYTRIRLVYVSRGVSAEDEAKLRRAVELSHEKYCSVQHSLRPDLELISEIELG